MVHPFLIYTVSIQSKFEKLLLLPDQKKFPWHDIISTKKKQNKKNLSSLVTLIKFAQVRFFCNACKMV